MKIMLDSDLCLVKRSTSYYRGDGLIGYNNYKSNRAQIVPNFETSCQMAVMLSITLHLPYP